eukprot:1266460-Alexandrium_andersonii.AAC.1
MVGPTPSPKPSGASALGSPNGRPPRRPKSQARLGDPQNPENGILGGTPTILNSRPDNGNFTRP